MKDFPILGGDGTKTVPPVESLGGGGGGERLSHFGRGRHENSPSRGDIFDRPRCERSSIWTKVADLVGDHVVLSSKEAVLVVSPGMESSLNPPPLPSVERF